MLPFFSPGFGGLIVNWEYDVHNAVRRDSISFYSTHSLCNISLNNCFKWLSVEFILLVCFLCLKTNITFMCSHPSWEGGDRDISFHTVCDTEPEMGHGGVQISLSLRDDLRLPDQFWQVTGSFQGNHICDRGQAGFHVSARTLQSQVGLRLLTIRVCGFTWFLFEIKMYPMHTFFYRCNSMSLLISPWLCSRSDLGLNVNIFVIILPGELWIFSHVVMSS